jgi:hypothetical protein
MSEQPSATLMGTVICQVIGPILDAAGISFADDEYNGRGVRRGIIS